MFNLQGGELIIILLLALVVLGPEKLPDAMRKAGKFYAELKKMSTGFQREFKAAIDEPVREVRETANLLRDSVDFRKLEEGKRPEKPKTADMVAQPTKPATPATDVPFAPANGTIDPPPETPTASPWTAPDPFANAEQMSASAPLPAPSGAAGGALTSAWSAPDASASVAMAPPLDAESETETDAEVTPA